MANRLTSMAQVPKARNGLATPLGVGSLPSSVSQLFAATCVYTLCQWLTLLTLIKLGSPHEVGRFSMAFAICAPVFMFANLELRSLLATDVNASIPFAAYYKIRLTCALGALIACGFLSVWLPNSYASIVLAMAVAKCFESVSDLVYGRWQQQRQFGWIARSMAVHGVVMLGMFALTFSGTQKSHSRHGSHGDGPRASLDLGPQTKQSASGISRDHTICDSVRLAHGSVGTAAWRNGSDHLAQLECAAIRAREFRK